MSEPIARPAAPHALPPPSSSVGLRCCVSCGASYRSDFSRCPNDGAEVRVMATDPLIGAVIEPYVIDALIGEGAMGRVYRAHHTRLAGRSYAVKVLRGDLATTADARIRFAREAETASTLDHPNVVGVIDFGRNPKGLLYLAMDLVDGQSVEALIERGPVAAARVVQIARGICRGLAYAHDHGLIHRDLKPANVILVESPDGEVPRIADFGIAIHASGNDARLTATGFTLGTPGYVSPEQMTTGKPFDHRADLYALGVTMFEMLSGELPFEGVAMDQMVAKVTRDPPTIAEVAPAIAVPPSLERLVRRLMARRAGDRFPTAHAVIEALDGLDLASPATTEQIPVRRRRWLPVVAIGMAAAAALAAGGWWIAGRDGASAAISPAITPAPPEVAAAPRPRSAPEPRPAPAVAGDRAVEAPRPPVGATDAGADDADDDRGRSHKRGRDPKQSARASVDETGPEPSTAATPTTAPGPATAPAGTPAPTTDTTEPATIAPATTTAPAPTPATPAAITPRAPAPTPAPQPQPRPQPQPPRAPRVLTATIGSLRVDGALAVGDVRRAIGRKLAALAACGREPASVAVEFVVGEARRARDISVSGGSAATNACTSAAIEAIRTEAAPDTGDARVTLRLELVERTP